MSLKLSFLYPIRNRRALFEKTVKTILEQDFDKSLIEFVVLDQGNDGLLDWLKTIPLRIVYMRVDMSMYTKRRIPVLARVNPSYLNNLCFRHSSGEALVLSSPEVYHGNEVVSYFLNNLGKVIYATVYDMGRDNNEIQARMRPVYSGPLRPDLGFYFLAMVPRQLFIDIDGIDEGYMVGHSVEDCDTGLKMNIFVQKGIYELEYTDKIFAFHQFHSSISEYGTVYQNWNLMYFKTRFDDKKWATRSVEEKHKFLCTNAVSNWGDNECLVHKEIING